MARLVDVASFMNFRPPRVGLGRRRFCISSAGNKDGCNSSGFVIFDEARNLFGATASGGGGLNNTFCNDGCGTVFELTKLATGKFTEKVIHRFTGENANGAILWEAWYSTSPATSGARRRWAATANLRNAAAPRVCAAPCLN
jgi:hypothetical protein